MDRSKQPDKQPDYRLNEVHVRLKLVEGEKPLYSSTPILNPEAASTVMGKMMSELTCEQCCVVSLNTALKPISYTIASIGTIDSAQIYMPSLFKAAILQNAASIMVLHNHPSGSLTPSMQDIDITRKMVQAGKLLDIPVVDHIIVAGMSGEYLSIRQYEPEIFKSGSRVEKSQDIEERKVQYTSGKEQVKGLLKKLEEGVQGVFRSDQYKEYLKCMSRLHQYSVGNSILIMLQKPDASMVAGYQAWQSNFGRYVNKGEKAIKILAPMTYKKIVEETDPDTGKTEKRMVPAVMFRPVSVFDVSQTSGKPIPSLGPEELKGQVDQYEDLMKAIKAISSVPIDFEKVEGGAKGYYSPGESKIVIKEGMDPIQTVKTALHELAHSELHTEEKLKDHPKAAGRRETEAESIAFVVSGALGIDTSEYSFPYLAGWSSGAETKELKESLETIRQTSDRIIEQIRAQLPQKSTEKEAGSVSQGKSCSKNFAEQEIVQAR